MALIIPNLGLFISLVGALCISMLGFSIPGMMEICILWPDNFGKFNYMLWKNILVVLFGFAALLIGTVTTIIDIIDTYSNN